MSIVIVVNLVLSAATGFGIWHVWKVQQAEIKSMKSLNDMHKEKSDLVEDIARLKYEQITGSTLNLAKKFDMTLDKYAEAMTFAHNALSKLDKETRDEIMDIHLKLNKSDLLTTLDSSQQLDA